MAAIKPYQDKQLLYELYVVKRKGIREISEILENNYNCKATMQTIYNWLEKFDLLKHRGKGRNINISRGNKSGTGGGSPYGPPAGTQKKSQKPPWR